MLPEPIKPPKALHIFALSPSALPLSWKQIRAVLPVDKTIGTEISQKSFLSWHPRHGREPSQIPAHTVQPAAYHICVADPSKVLLQVSRITQLTPGLWETLFYTLHFWVVCYVTIGDTIPNFYFLLLLQSRGGGGSFTINYYRKDSPFLSLEVPSPTPTC